MRKKEGVKQLHHRSLETVTSHAHREMRHDRTTTAMQSCLSPSPAAAQTTARCGEWNYSSVIPRTETKRSPPLRSTRSNAATSASTTRE